MNRLNKTESAVFLYCKFSLFLKDPFFFIRLFVVLSLKASYSKLETSSYTQVDATE